MSPDPRDTDRPGAVGLAVRIIALLAIVVAGTWAAHALREALDLRIMPANEQHVHRMIMAGICAYVVLLAIPFVPGAEIGLAMLTAFGSPIAPLVYGATVVAMLLAYAVGSLLPPRLLSRLLSTMRLRRASELVARAAPLSRQEKLSLLLERAPPRLLALALRHRYVALAIIINIPGNVIIGGGGGIMMLAGLSGLFAPLPTFLAVALGVSPVPLVILLLGA